MRSGIDNIASSTRLTLRCIFLMPSDRLSRRQWQANTWSMFGRPIIWSGQIFTARANVSFRRVLPLEGLLDMPLATEPSAAAHSEQHLNVHGRSSESEDIRPTSPAPEPQEMEDAAPQVRDWCFSELHTTDLAALREVDVCIPLRLPAFEDDHWNRLVAPPTMRGPKHARTEWYDAATAHWAAIKGLARSRHPTKQSLNSFWFKMYCHRNPTEPEPSALKAVTSFPYRHKDDGVIQYEQINAAAKTLWHSANTKVAQLSPVPIPKGITPWGTEAEKLLGKVGSTSQDPNWDLAQSSVVAAPAGAVAELHSRWSGRCRQADSRWDGPWQS